jgi:hypothetical protein
MFNCSKSFNLFKAFNVFNYVHCVHEQIPTNKKAVCRLHIASLFVID